MRIQLLCLMQLKMNKLHFRLVHDTSTPFIIVFFPFVPILFQIILTVLSCRLKLINFTFILTTDLFLITGGLYLLWGTSLYCCRFAHDRWDCYGRRPFLPICEDSLVESFNLFPLLVFLGVRSSGSAGCICWADFTFKGLCYVTHRSLGCICFTLQLEPSFTLWWVCTHMKLRATCELSSARSLWNNKSHKVSCTLKYTIIQ